jgi:polyhydroxyalkanoate synthesis regulator phasin
LKKIHKIVLATVLIAAMLIASIPVIAMAQAGKFSERQGDITSRVSEILGIDQQDLQNALNQAQTELRGENLDARLQELIAEGSLTQEQANEFKAWIAAKPDVPMVPPGQLEEALKNGTITQEQLDQLKAWMEAKPDIPAIMPTMGERLVEEGTVTQQQADEYKAWMESKPADIPNVGPRQLKKLLDNGEITQEQMDAFKAWIEARPDMPKIRPELRQDVAANLQERQDDLITRVASILNINVEDLENAFKQAQSELREKSLDTRLQELVNQGTWTQQQADQYKAWMEARPDVPRIGPMGPGGPWNSMGPGRPCGPMEPQQ